MKNLVTLLLFVSLSTIILSQQIDKDYFSKNSEVYFSFSISKKSEIKTLTRIISIDDVKGNQVYAYAIEKEFLEFEKLNYAYTILPHPGKLIEPEMSSSIEGIKAWDVYPTYDAYVNMLNLYKVNYPGLCRIVDGGLTV
ncbi:MAG: hypothetical protein WAR59_05595, partial [Ignavibacteriaceae bacterium]